MMYNEPPRLIPLYECDGEKCLKCHGCGYTTDIRHAKNFAQAKHSPLTYVEKKQVERDTYDDYQEAALRTASNIDDIDALLIEGIMGLNGEAGECIDILKKHLFQGHNLDRDHLAEELGDVAWYLAVAAHAIGWSLEDILKRNIEKLEKRYPNGFEAERSVNR
jgi:NTP pyrophosphatase (non-canonical NTP hydrolase)